MKIVFVSSEVTPFSKTGGLADVAAALPKALEKLGHRVYIITPKYKVVDEKQFDLVSTGRHIEIPVSNKKELFILLRRMNITTAIIFIQRRRETILTMQRGLYSFLRQPLRQ
ncbi:MAG: glycogen/starch synthase [Nitrospirae bacterium]|nr:glycogen/starch synthase [Nitrospirota bacterium]